MRSIAIEDSVAQSVSQSVCLLTVSALVSRSRHTSQCMTLPVQPAGFLRCCLLVWNSLPDFVREEASTPLFKRIFCSHSADAYSAFDAFSNVNSRQHIPLQDNARLQCW